MQPQFSVGDLRQSADNLSIQEMKRSFVRSQSFVQVVAFCDDERLHNKNKIAQQEQVCPAPIMGVLPIEVALKWKKMVKTYSSITSTTIL